MLKEHSQVVLKKPVPNLGLEPTMLVLLCIHAQGAAYEVEFLTLDGHTIGLRPLMLSICDQHLAVRLFTNVSD